MRPALALLIAALAVSGCATSGGGEVEGPVSVYVSLPLTGPRGADGRDAADGARLALEQAEGSADGLEVRAEFLDDAKGRAWDPIAVGANARRAAQDSSAAAYIAELDSEPTRASVPITNDANLVQVSPGAGGMDLTRPASGYPDTPDRYQPSGQPTFARIVPADDVEAEAIAAWATELGARTISAVSDGTAYGDLMVAQFKEAAEEAGIRVPPEAAAVDLAFSAGEADGLQLTGPGVTYETATTLDPSRLPDKRFAREFQASFGRAPGPYSAYGYEAMALVLQAIGDADAAADGFRDAVRQGVIGGERRESALGPYSITREGDSTVCAIQRYQVRGDARRPLSAPCP
ncbi:MAG: ABC transporter substrate-binding protein [Solirubrobacterales bacterium]